MHYYINCAASMPKLATILCKVSLLSDLIVPSIACTAPVVETSTSRVISYAFASIFECFHPYIEVCLRHTGRTIWSCRSGKNLACYYILSQQKSFNSFLFLGRAVCCLAVTSIYRHICNNLKIKKSFQMS